MALRVEAKAKLLISNDNSANPQDIAFNSGDKSLIDAALYAEASSKVLKLAPSTVDEQVDLDNITSVASLFMMTDALLVSVTLVPTGKILSDCSAIKLIPNHPMVIGSDLAAIYVSNADAGASASVKIGAAGN